MKAARVKGLDPELSLADNAALIVATRADELARLAAEAIAEHDPLALHNTRIAAKRLRYALELTGFCFGPFAAKTARRARAIQDVLGEIHDCDVLLPRIDAHVARLRQSDAEAAAERRDGTAADDDVAWQVAEELPHSGAYAGLEKLALYVAARREILYAQFLDLWARLESEGFRDRLDLALEQRRGSAEPDVKAVA